MYREKIEKLITRYEKYLKTDRGKEMDDYEQGQHNELLAVVKDLKELLES